MDPEFDERPFVDQQRQPLPRGQLVLGVLRLDLFSTAAQLDLLAPAAETLGQRAQRAGGGIGRHGREVKRTTSYFARCTARPSRRPGVSGSSEGGSYFPTADVTLQGWGHHLQGGGPGGVIAASIGHLPRLRPRRGDSAATYRSTSARASRRTP